ncbi:PREDICTED: uncharacterized protein LOC106723948 [Myotis brandtii]|uniref:uncharacterized protein LOC106723948 n=1 Tax=Myotis brandtii TaxID=109478 RepID=UPI0007047AF5|nr:PREDICTED: uncharacterized protein LOC106723948 [Myotis brandtii]XP_014384942.1 PREDICTED: uncharacterized protein LOC106723948 [Myotis brandtii]XP_014384947.1 PREDICTED: uncharacterized protein LOC106723948 [Myotis brandtii]XP_014384954.1 PREDICTED: uncharacterized protein LOC106723948 [Myotis brandtii]
MKGNNKGSGRAPAFEFTVLTSRTSIQHLSALPTVQGATAHPFPSWPLLWALSPFYPSGSGARPLTIRLPLPSLVVGLSLGLLWGGSPVAFSLLLPPTRVLAGGGQLGGNSVGAAAMSTTPALGQEKGGKDAPPSLGPEFTSSPVFPPKKPPTYSSPTSSNGSAEAKPAKLGLGGCSTRERWGPPSTFRVSYKESQQETGLRECVALRERDPGAERKQFLFSSYIYWVLTVCQEVSQVLETAKGLETATRSSVTLYGPWLTQGTEEPFGTASGPGWVLGWGLPGSSQQQKGRQDPIPLPHPGREAHRQAPTHSSKHIHT